MSAEVVRLTYPAIAFTNLVVAGYHSDWDVVPDGMGGEVAREFIDIKPTPRI
jgi:hypothetical protein